MKRLDNNKLNTSGCRDETAYEAVKNIRREERRKLIADITELAASRGYKITSNIRLVEIKEVNGI